MASFEQVENFRRAQEQTAAVARREMRSWWDGLDMTDLDGVRLATETVFPQIVAAYGEISAEVSAGWYEELRTDFATGSFTAALADPIPVGQSAASGRWALGSLFRGNPEAALAAMGGVTDRLVKQAGRNTILINSAVDVVPWARVPTGAQTCSFCRMLASRGAVYGSVVKAGQGNRYHAHCDCVPTPIAPGQELPAGYDPEALRAEYTAARSRAGSGDTSAILSEMDKGAARAARADSGRRLAALSDASIEDALSVAWESGDQAAADRLMLELDRRDVAAKALPKSQAARYTESVTSSWTDSDFDDELLHLMAPDAAGWVDQQAIDQVAHLMDVREVAVKADDALLAKMNAAASDAANVRSLLDKKPRRRPRTVDQQLRSDYDDFTHVEWLKAEDECNGVLLNKVGRAAGVDPRTLWQGTTARARKYASEELKTFWQRNGRINYGTFRADALGRASDRGSRQASTKEGWYDSAA